MKEWRRLQEGEEEEVGRLKKERLVALETVTGGRIVTAG
jgi:hypothetical protein